MKPVIAIDGPAASGKGTLSRMIAEHFCFAYLDSGRLYRAFACTELILSDRPELLLSNEGTEKTGQDACLSDICEDYDLLHTLSDLLERKRTNNEKIDFTSYVESSDFIKHFSSANELVSMAQKIPESILKSEIVGTGASILGKLPEVRSLLNSIMREFANFPGDGYRGSVIDGRDIGSTVFPDATCKVFLTADQKIRAERRLKDLQKLEGSTSETFESIYEDIKARDERDASRCVSPMTYDETYIVVDTSNITIKETFDKLVNIIGSRLQNA